MSDKITGKKIPKQYDETASHGTKLSYGTYIGVVKNVNDPGRNGKLAVWIPLLGGAEDDSRNWITVRYASPFLGSTNTPGVQGQKSLAKTFSASSQTYGFWAVPPDVGNQVLITFINGDRNKGFWFACIFDRDGHYMVPGNPGGAPGTDFDVNTVESATLKGTINQLDTANIPLSEFNRYGKYSDPVATRKKAVHEFLAPSYIEQGLAGDIVRGPTRSSSQRDIPSGVFGWSTPGRPKNDPGYNANQNKNADPTKPIYERVGGHSFVMDDGDYYGQGQQIRLRSAGGHQLLMDDTTGAFYVINAAGSCWIELSPTGQMSVYSGSSINMRTRGDLNLHSDQKVSIYGQSGIEMFTDGEMILEGAKQVGITGGDSLFLHGFKRCVMASQNGPIQIDANGQISLKTKGLGIIDAAGKLQLQSGKAPDLPTLPKGITTYDHDDTMVAGNNWVTRKRATKSTVAVLPTHEPWNREGYDAVSNQRIGIADGPAPKQTFVGGDRAASGRIIQSTVPEVGSALPDNYLDRFPGVKQGLTTTLGSNLLPKTNSYTSRSAPKATAPCGTLSQDKLSSLQAGIAYLETRGDPEKDGSDYEQVNRLRYAGRYQHGAQSLETLGYLKPGSYQQYGNAAFDRPECWSGKNGISNGRDYLGSPGEQEKAQQELTIRNYRQLSAAGVITADSPPEHVGGMLAVAHLLGAGGATRWARTGDGRDANGTTGATYYAAGSYAIQNKISY
jgi:hypothetical protein